MTSETVFAEALALTRLWCAIPSVRGNDAAMRAQADALVGWMQSDLGAKIIARTPARGRAEVLHARIDIGAPRTVILYNMYDVMPAQREGWSVDPWEGGIRDLPGVGESYIARGAENNKGPLAGMLCVLKALVTSGRLGVNVEILLDGEEENGSGGMRAYLEAPDCPVRPSAAAIFPSFCEYGGGPPRVYLGFSGIARGAVVVEGGAWGGPKTAIHSSNAPWIANPAARLVEALGRIGTAPTGTLGQITLDDAAAGITAKLAETFDPAAELRFRNTECFAVAGDALALLSHVLTTASFNISRIETQPAAGEGVIPQGARAGFELRAPPGLDPADYLARIAEDLTRLPGARLELDDSYPGTRFGAETPGVAALLAAYAESAAQPPQIWPWAIGAAPGYAFARHARSFLLAGAGRGGNAHGIDEFMTLEGYRRFLTSVELWLVAMAEGAR
ncbi:M20 family metallopeptidase [Rhodobacter lacus]|uniref:M20 family metallopeptidase n=1 Tax=Rhodobacter lacus TaxID=1641972 RepID=A0ABW5A6P9_9RHOB